MSYSHENVERVSEEDDVIRGRVKRNAGGGNGRNCGLINTQYFAAPNDPWRVEPLEALAAQVCEECPEYVQKYAEVGLYSGRISRRNGSAKTAKDVQRYISNGSARRNIIIRIQIQTYPHPHVRLSRRRGMVTNLTIALMAKGIRTDIYTVCADGIRTCTLLKHPERHSCASPSEASMRSVSCPCITNDCCQEAAISVTPIQAPSTLPSTPATQCST